MKLAFIVLFIAAACVQVWIRLKASTRAAITQKAAAMLSTAQEVARAMADKVFRRRTCYRAVFLTDRGELSPAGRVVIADLMKFCRGMTSTTVVSPTSGMVDPHASALAEGRREVLLRLLKELSVEPLEAMRIVREEDALAA